MAGPATMASRAVVKEQGTGGAWAGPATMTSRAVKVKGKREPLLLDKSHDKNHPTWSDLFLSVATLFLQEWCA